MSGWTSVEEIDAYRLAVELRDRIGRVVESGRVAGDFDFRDRIRGSAGSITKNLAEGFERYTHNEFAYFTRVAKGSLGETIDALKEGREKRYFTPEEFDALNPLAQSARKATTGLSATSCPQKPPANAALQNNATVVDPDEGTERAHQAPSTSTEHEKPYSR